MRSTDAAFSRDFDERVGTTREGFCFSVDGLRVVADKRHTSGQPSWIRGFINAVATREDSPQIFGSLRPITPPGSMKRSNRITFSPLFRNYHGRCHTGRQPNRGKGGGTSPTVVWGCPSNRASLPLFQAADFEGLRGAEGACLQTRYEKWSSCQSKIGGNSNDPQNRREAWVARDRGACAPSTGGRSLGPKQCKPDDQHREKHLWPGSAVRALGRNPITPGRWASKEVAASAGSR